MIPVTRAAAIVLAVLALASCARPTSGVRDHASAAARAACRQRADLVYNTQNRGEVYQSDNYATNDRDSPFASTGLSGITSSGLGGRYQRLQLEDDCLSSSGEGAPAPVAEPAASGPGAAPPVRGNP